MEDLAFEFRVERALGGAGRQAIVGVVASGNLEVLAERTEAGDVCRVEVSTAAEGFGTIWQAVVGDFVERVGPGGVRFSVNDGGRGRIR